MSTAAVATLRQRRCVNHPAREASARCPECGRFFCRECITEHDDRVLCASCLTKLSRKTADRARSWAVAVQIGLALGAIAVIFAAALIVGNLLLAIPSRFHSQGGW